jgi:16S rRNA (uracil1498-N3)-methyltransferase
MKSYQSKSPRLYLNTPFRAAEVTITKHQAHYLRRVLRLKPGDSVVIFNGAGDERHATVDTLSRDHAILRLVAELEPLPESPLQVALVQSLVKNDAMDMIVQKATELGVHSLIPVSTEFSVIRLDKDRVTRRVEHWKKIAAGACEQSGRHRPPVIYEPQALASGLTQIPANHLKLVLQPRGIQEQPAAQLPVERPAGVAVLIGPEGGLSERDIQDAGRAGFTRITLGARILRAETAALAACTLVQYRWGDLSS